MGVHSFHADPVIINEFPSGLAAVGSAELLPILHLPGALLIERCEFLHDPMGAVFGWGGGLHGWGLVGHEMDNNEGKKSPEKLGRI